jgi:hypothetical protein
MPHCCRTESKRPIYVHQELVIQTVVALDIYNETPFNILWLLVPLVTFYGLGRFVSGRLTVRLQMLALTQPMKLKESSKNAAAVYDALLSLTKARAHSLVYRI